MALSYKEVADIIKIIDASNCEEVVLEQEGTRLVIRRGGNSTAAEGISTTAASANVSPIQSAQAAAKTSPTAAAPAPAADGGDGITVSSPMVGTFYCRPSPEEEPFVTVGSKVAAGDPICMIEVMKLYTTIEASADGVIEAVVADDGMLVEFGQPLFIIRAA
jgi:acetyl-CoA carboxylase biotin carboxyl carrier protein